MSNRVWKLIAWICSRPLVFRFIVWLAQKQPYLHIGDYMNRWWIVPFKWGLPFSIRVHHIMRPDADPYLHDHPWNWRTIILSGCYLEETVFGNFEWRFTGFTGGNTAETFHRIHSVSDGGVWTLFIMGRRRNGWGFLTGCPARKTYYRDYQSVNDRSELQIPVD